MLLPTDTRPENSLYYIGGKIIKILLSTGSQGFMTLYGALTHEHSSSLKVFILALDWLYLCQAVVLDEEGNVHLVHK